MTIHPTFTLYLIISVWSSPEAVVLKLWSNSAAAPSIESGFGLQSTHPWPQILSSLCLALRFTLWLCQIPTVTSILDLLALRSLRHILTKLNWAPNFSLCHILMVQVRHLLGGHFLVGSFCGGWRHLLTPEFLPVSGYSRCGLLWWSCCSATHGVSESESVSQAFLSWMLEAEHWELHGTLVMCFLQALKLLCLLT